MSPIFNRVGEDEAMWLKSDTDLI